MTSTPADPQARERVRGLFRRGAAEMGNVPDFYEWALWALRRWRVHRETPIADVGCGPGMFLRRLSVNGYQHLAGFDFAPESLALAAKTAPGATLGQLDIEAAALPERYPIVLMLTVIDFLVDPRAALRNVRESLTADGRLFVTIRNRTAYWPWRYAAPAARLLGRWPRLRDWLLWFSVPLADRRDWEYERTYAPEEMRALLRECGFETVGEHGAQMLPMLWIPDVPGLVWLMRALDQVVRRLPANPLCFRYLFVCEVARGHGEGNGRRAS